MTNRPIVFDEFFELGKAETASPFITSETRQWGANLFLKASILSAVLLLLSFIMSFSTTWEPLSYAALIGVYFLAGIPALIESLEDLINFEININVLMTLAAFSSVLIGSGMEGGLLLVLFALSGAMEDAVRTKAKGAISSLRKLSPTTAHVVQEDGSLIERSIKEIDVGTPILIKSGQVVPLDGKVVDGISSVNLVHLTGENFPVTKKVGDEVPAGANNLEGALTLSVSHTGADSTIARIIQLVTLAQEARPKLQRWFDKVSKRYAITIILLATFFTFSMPLFLGFPFLGTDGSLYRSLAFLIAASPCALIIAIPIAYLSAVSICARRGILLKGGIVLDALASCKTFAFDKTGTLTTGDLNCISVEGFDHPTEVELNEAVAIAYALEKNAIHPIVKAILNYAKQQKIQPVSIKNFKAIPGYGLEGMFRNHPVYIGHPDYILKKLSKEKAKALEIQTDKMKKQGELVAVLLIEQKLFLFRFRETLRPKIKRTIDALKRRKHLAILMLTGDHEISARRMAQEIGIENYRANLRPEDKLNYVSKLAEERGLAMVGDGINDAPALARATVGICMGKVGMTAAMEASDIVLLHDNIEFLDWLVDKTDQTQKIVRQNLILATGAIVCASVPALVGYIPLWLAVILHEGGTVLVGLNALRLLRK